MIKLEAKQIGENVRKKRLAKPMTQQELSDRSGVSLPFIKRIEAQNATVSAPLLARIAKTLDVSMDVLVDHVKPDVELVDQLWEKHNLNSRFKDANALDYRAKKAILKSLALWIRD